MKSVTPGARRFPLAGWRVPRSRMSKTTVALSVAAFVAGILLVAVSSLAGGFIGAGIIAGAGLALALQLDGEVADYRPVSGSVTEPLPSDDEPAVPTVVGSGS